MRPRIFCGSVQTNWNGWHDETKFPPGALERTGVSTVRELRFVLPAEGLPQPEIMTAREMLAVGNPFVRLPELSR